MNHTVSKIAVLLSLFCLISLLAFSAGCITSVPGNTNSGAPLIGFIGAMDEETKYLIASLSNTQHQKIGPFEFYKGTLHGNHCVVGVSMVGKVYSAACTQQMISTYHPDVIINIGVGGALDENLKIGDLIIVESTVQHDYDLSSFGLERGQLNENHMMYIPTDKNVSAAIKSVAEAKGIHTVGGIGATGDIFIDDLETKRLLKSRFNASVCDMEGASIALICMENGVPCAICRTISDTLKGNSNEYQENVKSEGVNLGEIAQSILMHSSALIENISTV